MIKRRIIFGSYDTAARGWTLTGWKLADAVPKTNYIDKPGGDGSWDMSTVLTGGIMRYADRSLTASFESSEGDRLSREDEIRRMINELDGITWDIYLPDDPFHHVTGRVHVIREYNDPAHASVTVTATCEPWKYSNAETVVALTAATTAQNARIVNNGRRAVVPVLQVAGSGASVRLTYGAATISMSAGEYQWPDLLLTPGVHDITYSGNGTLTITYREAVLE